MRNISHCSIAAHGNLRINQTKPEIVFWRLLRSRRLDGFKFRRQQPIGPYILDFFCPEARLAIELDGGGHNSDEKRQYDEQRTRFLKSSGIHVLRFWNNQIFQQTDAVMSVIYDFLEKIRSLNPSP